MKKLVCILLACILLTGACGALAEGQMTLTQQNFIIFKNSSYYAYAYAKVENTGDAPIRLQSGSFEVYDKDGGKLIEKTYVNTYAAYLAPGEYTYVSAYDKLEVEDPAEAVNYRLILNPKDDASRKCQRLLAVPCWEPQVQVSKYSTYDYMTAVVTNNMDRTVYDMTVLLVLLDSYGNILFTGTENMGTGKGLNPGSSMSVRISVPDYRMKAISEAGLVPTRVDVIAYATVSNE